MRPVPVRPKGDRILLVDDSPETLEVLERNLADHGFAISKALNASDAMEHLRESPADLVITDVRMPGMSGLDLLRHLRENHPDMEVMLITGYATIEGAVEAVKTGAQEYLAKPFTADELLAAVGRALEKLHAARARRAGRSTGQFGLLGGSAGMRRAHEAMERAANTHGPVLLLGERGTGRERAARAIHGAGDRAKAPFLILDGETIPPEEMAFEMARGLASAAAGTLFLGTAEAWSPEALDLLETGHEDDALTARIIASASPDLPSLAARGGCPTHLASLCAWDTILFPPLRERGADILLMAQHYAVEAAQSLGLPSPEFSDGLCQALRVYAWPGNVGELRDVIVGAVKSCGGGKLDLPDLPAIVRSSTIGKGTIGRPLAEVEGEYIREVLASVDGNKSRAAEILGIDRKTLREKLKPDAS